MKTLLKQHRQLKSQLRKVKKDIRNAQDTKKKCCIVLEKIGREVSRFYVMNKDEVQRAEYMHQTQIEVKKLQKTLANAEKTIKSETPKLGILESELKTFQAQLKKDELQETQNPKTISLKLPPIAILYVSKKKKRKSYFTKKLLKKKFGLEFTLQKKLT